MVNLPGKLSAGNELPDFGRIFVTNPSPPTPPSLVVNADTPQKHDYTLGDMITHWWWGCCYFVVAMWAVNTVNSVNRVNGGIPNTPATTLS